MTDRTWAHYHRAGIITSKELHVLELRYPLSISTEHRMSQRTIATALGITRWAVRDRIRSGLAKIARHEQEAA